MLSVCFLWHMHQPCYVDASTRTALMPWVRLHAVKGYWDMICLLDDFPGVRVSFNLTPILVKQIQELASEQVRDQWLEWAAIPAEDLNEEQRLRLLENYFRLHWDNLVRPYPRFWQLLHKRGTDLRKVDLRAIARQWSAADFRDLQVWFNLAWCGHRARATFSHLAELVQKGSGFSETDKNLVLQTHREILRQVLAKYRDAAHRGQIELTTSPYFHPIMPLLYDTEFARRCMPATPLPSRFSHPEDIQTQLQMAVQLHEETFGLKPRGLWPSEGAVCPELIPLFREQGIEWFATDEEILFRSLHAEGWSRADRRALHSAYHAEHAGASVPVVFRDRSLSDFIGFSAAKNPPEAATAFFLEQLRQIGVDRAGDPRLVAIILDGENAWEYFPDGGENFLRNLYTALSREPRAATDVFSDWLAQNPPTRTLSRLHTGSWIRADFDVWIGDAEENRAWELLGQARRFWEGHKRQEEPSAVERAAWSLYAAEGSDWFWWYGPEFHTDTDHLFDMLFRRHLSNVYKELGMTPPDILQSRIRQIGTRLPITPPRALLRPVIDGRVTSFFEWQGAGCFEAGGAESTMYAGHHALAAIYFGFDLENVYLRLDFRSGTERKGVWFRVHVVEPSYRLIEVAAEDGVGARLAESHDGGLSFVPVEFLIDARLDQIVELSIPFVMLGAQLGQRIALVVQEMHGNVEIARYPEGGPLSFTLPTAEFEVENWWV